MSADYSTFTAQFLEFAGSDVTQVTLILAAADLEIDREIWGAKADQGQMYLAAHKLSLSAYGNNAQLVLKQPNPGPHGETLYGTHYDALVRQCASGFRVA